MISLVLCGMVCGGGDELSVLVVKKLYHQYDTLAKVSLLCKLIFLGDSVLALL